MARYLTGVEFVIYQDNDGPGQLVNVLSFSERMSG